MKGRFSSSWFPLLGKELIELANRRRTYVVRFLYAAALFGCGLMILYGKGGVAVETEARLGEGRAMFERLVSLQLAGIYVLLPAMCAASIAGEKERDTLTLLLLTTMNPWAIPIQKYLGRVIPMICFVILSFPLLAVAYSYGGVPTASLYGGMLLLLLAVLHVAAVALMCSAYCRTTVEAFLAAYLLLAVTSFCIPVGMPVDLLRANQTFQPAEFASRLVIAGMATAGYLLAARVFLISRASVPPRNILLQCFHALDEMYQEMNKLTGGVVLVNDGNALPVDDPIAWRETRKRSLGTVRYLFRVLVVLELPILVVAQEVNLNAIQNRSAVSVLLYVLWVIGTGLICIHAASVVSSERSRQTLDALLTAPVSGREFLRQKMAGVQRLILVLQVPFCTIFLFHHWLRDFKNDCTYLALSLATGVIFPQATAWFALWLGLRIRSQMRAVLTAIASVAVLASLPMLLNLLVTSLGSAPPRWMVSMLSVSPVAIVQRLESWDQLVAAANPSRSTVIPTTILLTCVLAVYAAAAWWLRRYCLKQADSLLGRVPDSPARRAARSAAQQKRLPIPQWAASGSRDET